MKKILSSVFICLFFTACAQIDTSQNKASKSAVKHCPSQAEVSEYFKEIALGIEFSKKKAVIRKWKSPIKVFVRGKPKNELLTELDTIISDIYTLENHPSIQIVSNASEANYVIFFGSSHKYTKIEPNAKPYLGNNWGFFYIYWNGEQEITNGSMYVDTTRANLVEQKHILREELTQSLGLGNDSYKYADSIFQQEWTKVNQYSTIDKEIISLLYHPKLQTNVNAQSIKSILPSLIKPIQCD